MQHTDPPAGTRMFLFSILDLIRHGETEKTSVIEHHLSSGVATYLWSKFPQRFDRIGFDPDRLSTIDEEYKQWAGVSDGKENKYACGENDGLYLVMSLALNYFL